MVLTCGGFSFRDATRRGILSRRGETASGGVMHWVDLYYGARDRLVVALGLLVVMLVVVEGIAVPNLLWLVEVAVWERKQFAFGLGLAGVGVALLAQLLRSWGTPLFLVSALNMAVIARILNIGMEEALQVPYAVGGLMFGVQFLVLAVTLYLGAGPVTFFAVSYGGMLLLHLVVFGVPGLFSGALIAGLPVTLVAEEILRPTALEEHDTPLAGGIMLLQNVALALMMATWAQLICFILWTITTDL